MRGLTRHGVFTDVSFTVRGGEIVALAGLVGAGRSEVIRAVFGVDRYDARRGAGRRASGCRRATRPRRSPPGSRWCRRTAASRAW